MTPSTEIDPAHQRAGEAVAQLCQVMARLRAPGGCAWDREQTLATLKPYLIEEAYEVLEAMEQNDARAHCEELGDLLLQIVFQTDITQAQDAQAFSLTEVANGIREKLIRRHPHVFGDVKATDASAALASWEGIKAQERAAKGKKVEKEGVLSGIPRTLPALLRAMRMGEKAAAVGFDWNSAQEVAAKVDEEWREVAEAVASGKQEAIAEELGDMLFALVNFARRHQVDPESALRAAGDKFQRRFGFMEAALARDNRLPKDATFTELDGLWEAAKRHERKPT